MRIDITGWQQVVKALSVAEGLQFLVPAMRRAMNGLVEYLAQYPSPRRKPQPFKTAKQRRFFFWALRAGLIQVPYRRTGTLGRRWTKVVTTTGTGLSGRVGNVTAYGPFVQRAGPDTPSQSSYHAGNWKTDQDAVTAIGPWIVRQFEDEIVKMIGGFGR